MNIPIRGERHNGDGYFVRQDLSRPLFAVVDGLGHGAGAEAAAEAGLAIVREFAAEPLPEILERAHDAMRSTRGGAMSLVAVDPEKQVVTFAGVGNVSAVLSTGGTTRSTAPQNGTVGAVMPRRLQEYTYPYVPGTMLVMYSDGVASRCSLTGYPGLALRHPQLIAGVLYRDFGRRRDDATVLVARLEGARG